MEDIYKTTIGLKPHKDTSNKGFSSNEINLEKYLLKYKASNINSLFHRLKDFTKDRDIQEVLDWYSNFDGATKREITSYKSKKLIDFIGQLYLKEMDISNKVNTKNYCDKEQDIYDKKPSEEKSDFYMSSPSRSHSTSVPDLRSWTPEISISYVPFLSWNAAG